MKKLVYTALFSLSLAPLLSGCAEDDIQDMFPAEYHKILYILESGEQNVTLYNTGEPADYTFSVCKAGSDPSLGAEVSIETISQAEVDEMYCLNEGIPYRIIPLDCYSIDQLELAFGGSETSKQVTVSVDAALVKEAMEAETEDTRWLLPLRAVSENDSVNSEKDSYIMLFDGVVTPPVGFRTAGVQVYNHDFTSGAFSASNAFGLLTVQNSWEVSAAVTLDKDYVAAYNEEHNTNYQIPAEGTYSIPGNVTLTADAQDATVDISITDFGDAKSGYFMLPLRLSDVSRFELSADASLWAPVVRLVGKRFDRSGWTATGCSEELTGEGDANGRFLDAIDGDINTYWHASWQSSPDNTLPHWFIVDSQTEREFTQVGIVQRASSSYKDVRDVNVYVSSDGEDWGQPAASFTVEAKDGEQIFDVTPTRGRYVKLEFVNSWRDNGTGNAIAVAEAYFYGED